MSNRVILSFLSGVAATSATFLLVGSISSPERGGATPGTVKTIAGREAPVVWQEGTKSGPPAPRGNLALEGRDAVGVKTGGEFPNEYTTPLPLAGEHARFMALRNPGQERMQLLTRLARRWAEIDPAGAMTWAFHLETGDGRIAARWIIPEWAASDPEAAFAFLSQSGGDPEQLRAFGVSLLLEQWSAADPSGAWEAASTLDNASIRSLAESDILLSWAAADPASAGSVLEALAMAGNTRGHLFPAFGQVAQHLCTIDLDEALRWVNGLSEGAAKESAVQGLMQSWTRDDPEAASTWLRDLDSDATRDVGIRSLVQTVRHEAPGSAYLWAREITDPVHRRRLTEQAALYWLSAEPGSARRAIETDGRLSVAERRAILDAYAEANLQ